MLFPTRKKTETQNPPAKLLRVRYASSGGAMNPRSTFEIEVDRTQILRCSFWTSEGGRAQPCEKAHVPISPDRWAEVEKIVLILYPLLEPVHPPSRTDRPEVRVLDGGDYSRLFLTWQTTDGEQTQQYSQPDDRRFTTLTALLHELAEPIGREILWYDPPVLSGMYFQDEAHSVSYQCTPWGSGEAGYRFIVSDLDGGEKRSCYLHVPDDVWVQVQPLCTPFLSDALPAASFRDALSVTLYYSDGRQRRVIPKHREAQRFRNAMYQLTTKTISTYKKGDLS